MSFKVLNTEWERIIVDTIDPDIHRHLSGRDFTENDACLQNSNNTEIWKTIDIEEAREKYKDRFGKNPHHKMKLETIMERLIKK